MTDMINIGVRSLQAYESALTVASDNIANANTPNYSRRKIEFQETAFSNGVNVTGIQQIFDQAANDYAQVSNSNASESSIYLQRLQGFEPVIDDDTNSVRTYLNDALQSLEELNTDAGSIRNRTLFLAKLNDLASRFQGVNNEINRETNNVNSSLQTDVSTVNQLLTSLNNINNQVVKSQGSDLTSLVDDRQAVIYQLSKYFDFKAEVNSNNLISVSLSNGLTLLSGNTPTLFLTTTPDPGNPGNLLVAAQSGSGIVPIDNLIQSGEISGLVNFRNNGLAQTQRSLGVLALAYSNQFNTQNKLGIDGTGNLGNNIFNDINNSTIIANRVLSNAANTGTSSMTLAINNVSKLTASDYALDIGSANAYTLTRISDGVVVGSGTMSGTYPQSIPINSEGFTITVNSGTFNAGDQYVVSPSYGAINNMSVLITDPNKLALGWPVIANPAIQNVGTGLSSVTAITDTTNASFATPKALTPPIQIQFLTSTSYQLVNATTSAVIEGPIAYNPATGGNVFPTPGAYDPGYRISLSGAPVAGDVFNIAFNSNSTNDNRNGLAMEQLYQTGILQGGQNALMTFNQAYDLINSNVAIITNAATINDTSNQAIKNSADQTVDSISGVSIEEETINIARYQQAYQASAQILQAARAVLDTIIGLTRGA